MTARPSRRGRTATPRVPTAERLERRVLLAAQLLKDINSHAGYGSDLTDPVVAGSVAFFGEQDGVHGDELWSTDGTPDGTQLVKDINPGVGNSFLRNLTNAGGITYFAATDGVSGAELWRTDGTADGTYLVKDVNPGPADSSPTDLTADGSDLYFFADDGVHGRELWKTDGTPDGTGLVVDTKPGAGGQNFTSIHRIAVTDDGTVYFSASDCSHAGLYATDGTADGTTLITHPQAGINEFFPDGNELYYSDGIGFVYATDGTSGQPVMLDGVNSSAGNFVDVSGTVFFARPTGIKQISGITVSTVPGSYKSPGSLVSVNGSLYFGANSTTGTPQLWAYTPGDATAVVVANNLPVLRMADVNGTLYVVAGSFDKGYTLYTSDGTAGGTTPARPINPGGRTPIPSGLVSLGSQLLFANSDTLTGSELWVSDGTSDGTHLLKDVFPGTESSFPFFFQRPPLNNKLLFEANDGTTGNEPWITDGTAAGTMLLKDIGPGTFGAGITDLVVAGNRAYFTAIDGTHGSELWATDGTPAGTFLLDDINPGSHDSTPQALTQLGDWVYFNADDGVHGAELWRTNGTAAGTQLVADLNPGSGASNPSELLVANNLLYFVATTSTTGAELWRSDGTAAGTTLVKDIAPGGADSAIRGLTSINGTLYFAAVGTTGRSQLWKSDGTSAGTVALSDVAAGFLGVQPPGFTAVGNEIYFSANDGSTGTELWKTDGTANGTVMVADISPGPASSNPSAFTVLYGRLFFLTFDSTNNQRRLWSTSGTAATTAPVARDLPLNVLDMTAIGGRLFLIADDGDGASDELWTSDGTDAGTVRLQDLFPGFPSGAAGFPVSLNGDVYITGDDGVAGVEPFRFRDTFAPFVWNSQVGTGNGTTLTFSFNEPMTGLSSAGIAVVNTKTGVQVPTKSIAFSYDPQSDTATFTLPALPAASYRAVLSAGGITDRAGNPLAQDQSLQFDLSTVSGSVFNDANHNKTHNAGEAGMIGVAVYLDLNGNGKLDAGEPSTASDSNGNYVVSTISAGAFAVKEVAPSGWRRTAPLSGSLVVQTAAAQAASGPVFGNVQVATVPLNFAYLLGLAQHYNSAGTFADGDLNGDDKVDFADLLILAQNYGHTLPAAKATGQSSRHAR